MSDKEDRKQGAWAHPSVYEAAKAIEHCRYLRDGLSRPCKTSSREKVLWCDECVGSAAISEIDDIFEMLNKLIPAAKEGAFKGDTEHERLILDLVGRLSVPTMEKLKLE